MINACYFTLSTIRETRGLKLLKVFQDFDNQCYYIFLLIPNVKDYTIIFCRIYTICWPNKFTVENIYCKEKLKMSPCPVI